MVVQTGIGRMCEGLEIPGLCEKSLSTSRRCNMREEGRKAPTKQKCKSAVSFLPYSVLIAVTRMQTWKQRSVRVLILRETCEGLAQFDVAG